MLELSPVLTGLKTGHYMVGGEIGMRRRAGRRPSVEVKQHKDLRSCGRRKDMAGS
jgi:hypothetical protein